MDTDTTSTAIIAAISLDGFFIEFR